MHISVCAYKFIFYPLAASLHSHLHTYTRICLYVNCCVCVCLCAYVCICIILRRTFWLKYFNNRFLCAAAGSKDIVIRPLAVCRSRFLALSPSPTFPYCARCSLNVSFVGQFHARFFDWFWPKQNGQHMCTQICIYLCVCVGINMYRCACVHSMYLRMCKRLVRRRWRRRTTASNNNNKALLVFAAFSLCIFAWHCQAINQIYAA